MLALRVFPKKIDGRNCQRILVSCPGTMKFGNLMRFSIQWHSQGECCGDSLRAGLPAGCRPIRYTRRIPSKKQPIHRLLAVCGKVSLLSEAKLARAAHPTSLGFLQAGAGLATDFPSPRPLPAWPIRCTFGPWPR